jgi:hypothetical protein
LAEKNSVCGKTRAGRGSLLISGGGRLASTLPRANGRRGEEERAPLICTLGLLFGAARQGESRRCRCDSSFRRQRPPFRPFPTSFFSACRGVASSARPRSTASVAAKAFAASPESRESRLRAVSSFVSLRRWWRVTAAGAWVSVRGSHAWLLWSWSSPPIRVVSYSSDTTTTACCTILPTRTREQTRPCPPVLINVFYRD